MGLIPSLKLRDGARELRLFDRDRERFPEVQAEPGSCLIEVEWLGEDSSNYCHIRLNPRQMIELAEQLRLLAGPPRACDICGTYCNHLTRKHG